MNKHLQSLHELHHVHKLTHKIIALIIFSIIVLLAVYGLSRVRAEESMYTKVPNADPGVCYKVGTNFNNPLNHVSCKNHESVCQLPSGHLVGCKTGLAITSN